MWKGRIALSSIVPIRESPWFDGSLVGASPAAARCSESRLKAPGRREQAYQLCAFRDDLGFARFRPDLARTVCDADFVTLRVEPFEDFVAVLRFGADLDFLAVALAGARLFVGDVFAFVRRLVGWVLERRLRAPITAPDTAPINVPTTGVPIAVPTTAPATAPPRVLLAAPFSSLDRTSFLSSSVMFDLLVPVVVLQLGPGASRREKTSGPYTGEAPGLTSAKGLGTLATHTHSHCSLYSKGPRVRFRTERAAASLPLMTRQTRSAANLRIMVRPTSVYAIGLTNQ